MHYSSALIFNFVPQVQKRVFIENTVPLIISLKRLLEQKRSPVLKDLMTYLQVRHVHLHCMMELSEMMESDYYADPRRYVCVCVSHSFPQCWPDFFPFRSLCRTTEKKWRCSSQEMSSWQPRWSLPWRRQRKRERWRNRWRTVPWQENPVLPPHRSEHIVVTDNQHHLLLLNDNHQDFFLFCGLFSIPKSPN